MDFPSAALTRLRTNNAIEHLNREIKCRMVPSALFPDGQDALMSAMDCVM